MPSAMPSTSTRAGQLFMSLSYLITALNVNDYAAWTVHGNTAATIPAPDGVPAAQSACAPLVAAPSAIPALLYAYPLTRPPATACGGPDHHCAQRHTHRGGVPSQPAAKVMCHLLASSMSMKARA